MVSVILAVEESFFTAAVKEKGAAIAPEQLLRQKRPFQVPPDSALIQQLVPGATVTRARALIPDARGAAPESVQEETDGEDRKSVV